MEPIEIAESRRPGTGAALAAFALFMAVAAGAYAYQSHRADEWGGESDANGSTRSHFDAEAFMHESRVTSETPDFRGADVATVMGQCIIDLRRADIATGQAEVENFIFWGQTQIRVPENWTVERKGLLVWGGFKNTVHPDKADPAKRLRLTGLVLMGQLTVSN